VLVPARGRCGGCGAEFDAPDPLAACPACGGLDVAFTGGDELTLESIEYKA
jgi:hydrogenase nickel incorporation protein HypA/HybF